MIRNYSNTKLTLPNSFKFHFKQKSSIIIWMGISCSELLLIWWRLPRISKKQKRKREWIWFIAESSNRLRIMWEEEASRKRRNSTKNGTFMPFRTIIWTWMTTIKFKTSSLFKWMPNCKKWLLKRKNEWWKRVNVRNRLFNIWKKKENDVNKPAEK